MRLSMRISQVVLGAVAAFGLVLAGLFGLPSAHAHDQLTGGDPASGDAVAKAPDTMTLTFSGEIRTVSGGSANQIIVTDRDGEEVTHGEVDVEGHNTMRDLQPLPKGTYDVQWSALSSDGHRVDGNYSFTVTEGASKKEIAAWEEKNSESAEDSASDSAEASSDAAAESELAESGEEGSESESAQADVPESTTDTTTIMWIVGGVLVVAIVIGILLQMTRKKPRDH